MSQQKETSRLRPKAARINAAVIRLLERASDAAVIPWDMELKCPKLRQKAHNTH